MYYVQLYNYCIGPRPPERVTNVTTIHITSYEATIQWRVPFLSYTPEIYTIHYYNATDSLISTQPNSGTNFNRDLNLIFNVRLISLAPGANYTYFISAANSNGNTSSETMSFITNDFGMLTAWPQV